QVTEIIVVEREEAGADWSAPGVFRRRLPLVTGDAIFQRVIARPRGWDDEIAGARPRREVRDIYPKWLALLGRRCGFSGRRGNRGAERLRRCGGGCFLWNDMNIGG